MFGRNLMCFDPWRELREMEDVFERIWEGERPRGFPAVDFHSSGDDVVVTAELPGVEPKDVDISVEGRTLTISGERRPGNPGEGETFHRRERWHGRFSRTVELPFGVESAKAKAGFKNGVLTVRLPRAEAEKPRKVEISNN